jgi:hypothetical protein
MTVIGPPGVVGSKAALVSNTEASAPRWLHGSNGSSPSERKGRRTENVQSASFLRNSTLEKAFTGQIRPVSQGGLRILDGLDETPLRNRRRRRNLAAGQSCLA